MNVRIAPREGAATQLRLRPLEEDDLPFAASLHAALLSHGFFGRLGPRFLRTYYQAFTRSPYAHAEMALLGERPVGVLVGTLDNHQHYAWVLRHLGVRLAVTGVLGLLAHPRELRLFLRTRVRRYVRGLSRLVGLPRGRARPAGPQAVDPCLVAVLTHVCVSAEAQGRGAGGALTRSFLNRARSWGAREAQLVTLAGPRGAGGFYERAGWSCRGEHPGPDGQSFRAYARSL